MISENARLKTPEIRFRVEEPGRSVFSGAKPTQYLWFRVLEHGAHYRQGLSIPTRHAEYSGEITHTLHALEEGDLVTATLVADDPNAPDWRVESITTIEHGSG